MSAATATNLITMPARETARALSPSQVTAYLDCAARWFYDQVSAPQPATGALLIGRVVDQVLTWALGSEPGSLPSESDLREATAAAFAAELPGAELRETENAIAMEDQAAQMAALFMRQAAPGLEVAALQEAVSGPIGTARARGIIDIRTVDGELIDIKTAAKKPDGISSSHALQLTTYALLKHTKRVRVITLTKTKEPALYSHAMTISPQHTQYAVNMFSIVDAAIAGGIHPPNRGSHLCSRKHCAHWRACQEEHGGFVKE